MSLCHLLRPQDTKWHKVPLGGEDTCMPLIIVAICRIEPFFMPNIEKKNVPDTYVYKKTLTNAD